MTGVCRGALHFIIILLGTFTKTAFGQSDTVTIAQFEVTDVRITVSESFKKTVLDSLAIQRHYADNVGTLLAENTGVFVKQYSPGGTATPSFRGTGASHTKVYWNGISVNSINLGLTDLSLLPVAFVNRVEVHHGSSSLVDGSGGLGGSLQLSHTVDWSKRFSGEAVVSGGSFGDYFGSLKLTMGNAKLQSLTSLFHHKVENDYPFTNIALQEAPSVRQSNAQTVATGVLQEISVRLNAMNVVAVKLMALDNSRNVPGVMTDLTESTQHQDDRSVRNVLEWSHVKNKLKTTVRAAYSWDRLYYEDDIAGIASLYTTNAIRTQLRGRYALNKRLVLSGAAFIDHDIAHSDGFEGGKAQSRQALMLTGDYFIGQQLKIDLLARQDVIDAQLAPILPSLGIRFKPFSDNDVYIKANFARNFNAPSLNDLYWTQGGNPDLKPEKGWSSELGLTT